MVVIFVLEYQAIIIFIFINIFNLGYIYNTVYTRLIFVLIIVPFFQKNIIKKIECVPGKLIVPGNWVKALEGI